MTLRSDACRRPGRQRRSSFARRGLSNSFIAPPWGDLGPWPFSHLSWLTFVLRRFPYTRPWGESMRAFLLDQLTGVGIAVLQALPGLFTVALIFLITRFVIRLVQLLFQSLEDGRVALPWMYPETAQPTRKIVTVGLWLFAIVIAYPYLPGSDSEAFKGMSVFVGLVVSLGSSGIVNQVMSGFTLTYSRALRVGDFVAVGDVEGTVTQVGTLSTKITTAKGEDVTIPNAVVVSQTVTNYSRFAEDRGRVRPNRDHHRLRRAVAAGSRRCCCWQRREAPGSVASQRRSSDNRRSRMPTSGIPCCSASSTPSSAGRRWRPCTRTSSTRSTSTACRSRRPTTRPTPERRRSCRAISGSRPLPCPRRPAPSRDRRIRDQKLSTSCSSAS